MTNMMEKGKIKTLRTWNKNKVEGKDRSSLNSILNIKWQDYTVVMASVHTPPLLSSACVRLWDSLP